MENWKIYWQDIAAMIAGAWLIVTIPAQIGTAMLFSGVVVFVSGALIVVMSGGAFGDDDPVYSWVTAGAGLVALVTAFVLAIFADPLAAWSVLAGGALAVAMSVWSATLKKRPTEPTERRAVTGRPIKA